MLTEITPGITRYQFDSNDDWLNARKGIGGSDAAALIGLNPYKTNQDLWREKTGQIIPEDISDKSFVKYGHDAEPLLRQLFVLDYPEYKVDYFENNLIHNKKYPFAHASLDGELTDKKGRKGILEIKTTTLMRGGQLDKWKDRVPDNYYCQVLWYLMVTEYDFAILKAQIKTAWNHRAEIRHYFFECEELEEDIEILREEGKKFWQCVEENREPYLILPEI